MRKIFGFAVLAATVFVPSMAAVPTVSAVQVVSAVRDMAAPMLSGDAGESCAPLKNVKVLAARSVLMRDARGQYFHVVLTGACDGALSGGNTAISGMRVDGAKLCLKPGVADAAQLHLTAPVTAASSDSIGFLAANGQARAGGLRSAVGRCSVLSVRLLGNDD